MEKNARQSLHTHSGLPAEFQLILADYPRGSWKNHRDFNGLAAFWLDRHLAFGDMMRQLTTEAQARIDRKLSAADYAKRLQRLGTQFLGDLVGHHQIEDTAYFPQLAKLEPRIARGFDMLDGDHHDLHALIDRFAKGANAVLAQNNDIKAREETTQFLRDVTVFQRMLARHLIDEEDLVLPVVLKHRVG